MDTDTAVVTNTVTDAVQYANIDTVHCRYMCVDADTVEG